VLEILRACQSAALPDVVLGEVELRGEVPELHIAGVVQGDGTVIAPSSVTLISTGSEIGYCTQPFT
jgi:hypothetical protein